MLVCARDADGASRAMKACDFTSRVPSASKHRSVYVGVKLLPVARHCLSRNDASMLCRQDFDASSIGRDMPGIFRTENTASK